MYGDHLSRLVTAMLVHRSDFINSREEHLRRVRMLAYLPSNCQPNTCYPNNPTIANFAQHIYKQIDNRSPSRNLPSRLILFSILFAYRRDRLTGLHACNSPSVCISRVECADDENIYTDAQFWFLKRGGGEASDKGQNDGRNETITQKNGSSRIFAFHEKERRRGILLWVEESQEVGSRSSTKFCFARSKFAGRLFDFVARMVTIWWKFRDRDGDIRSRRRASRTRL